MTAGVASGFHRASDQASQGQGASSSPERDSAPGMLESDVLGDALGDALGDSRCASATASIR